MPPTKPCCTLRKEVSPLKPSDVRICTDAVDVEEKKPKPFNLPPFFPGSADL